MADRRDAIEKQWQRPCEVCGGRIGSDIEEHDQRWHDVFDRLAAVEEAIVHAPAVSASATGYEVVSAEGMKEPHGPVDNRGVSEGGRSVDGKTSGAETGLDHSLDNVESEDLRTAYQQRAEFALELYDTLVTAQYLGSSPEFDAEFVKACGALAMKYERYARYLGENGYGMDREPQPLADESTEDALTEGGPGRSVGAPSREKPGRNRQDRERGVADGVGEPSSVDAGTDPAEKLVRAVQGVCDDLSWLGLEVAVEARRKLLAALDECDAAPDSASAESCDRCAENREEAASAWRGYDHLRRALVEIASDRVRNEASLRQLAMHALTTRSDDGTTTTASEDV